MNASEFVWRIKTECVDMIPINYFQIIVIFKSQVNKHFFLAYKNKIQRYIYIIYSKGSELIKYPEIFLPL